MVDSQAQDFTLTIMVDSQAQDFTLTISRSVTRKNRQMSIKIAQILFHYKKIDFDIFTVIV